MPKRRARRLLDRIKVNDLFLDELEVRHLALNGRLTAILSTLLGGAPMVCNSLNFMWGSQQPAHLDTWYMPPPVQNKHAVSSICLEDVHPEVGPLTYYPGSHKLKPHVFSHRGIHAVDAEKPACRACLKEQLKAHNLHSEEFIGKAGDVFTWHGQLLHGGTGIKDLARTRKSLVALLPSRHGTLAGRFIIFASPGQRAPERRDLLNGLAFVKNKAPG